MKSKLADSDSNIRNMLQVRKSDHSNLIDCTLANASKLMDCTFKNSHHATLTDPTNEEIVPAQDSPYPHYLAVLCPVQNWHVQTIHVYPAQHVTQPQSTSPLSLSSLLIIPTLKRVLWGLNLELCVRGWRQCCQVFQWGHVRDPYGGVCQVRGVLEQLAVLRGECGRQPGAVPRIYLLFGGDKRGVGVTAHTFVNAASRGWQHTCVHI